MTAVICFTCTGWTARARARPRCRAGKARTAALGRRETKVYEDMIKQGRVAFLSAPMTAMLEGGVPIVVGADIVGAVGVSGVKSDQDAAVARAGIAALGDRERLSASRLEQA